MKQVMDFVQRVRDSRTAQARQQAMKRVTYGSVVQEESVPQLGFSLGGGSFFPKRKRSLRPEVQPSVGANRRSRRGTFPEKTLFACIVRCTDKGCTLEHDAAVRGSTTVPASGCA